ncbi:VanZ family protein [Pseudactinotalea suaedae]|uniref:VanZ family protein n=1 Tax=Pseudactinotalea suaedae TaxID=1524924 RepID=UPI0012E1E4E1|nr:VanZ family protein [Pseudactinotalea suaedae]
MSTDEAVARPRPRVVLPVIAWVAFGLAVLANLWGLYAPSQPGPALFPGADKLAHAGSFALVTLTGLLAGVRPRPFVVGVAAHAVVSEVVQATLLPSRSGDVADLAADVVGIALGWLAWSLIRRRRRASATRRPVRRDEPAGTGPDR